MEGTGAQQFEQAITTEYEENCIRKQPQMYVGYGGLDNTLPVSTNEPTITDSRESAMAGLGNNEVKQTTDAIKQIESLETPTYSDKHEEYLQQIQQPDDTVSGLNCFAPTLDANAMTDQTFKDSSKALGTESQAIDNVGDLQSASQGIHHVGYFKSEPQVFDNVVDFKSESQGIDSVGNLNSESHGIDNVQDFNCSPHTNITNEALNKCSDRSPTAVIHNHSDRKTKLSQKMILNLQQLLCQQVNIQETQTTVTIECTKATKEWLMLDCLANSKLNTVDATGDMDNKAIYTTINEAIVNFTLLRSDGDFNFDDEHGDYSQASEMQSIKIEPLASGPEHNAVNELILGRDLGMVGVNSSGLAANSKLKRKRKVGVRKSGKKKKQEVVASNLISGQKRKGNKPTSGKDKLAGVTDVKSTNDSGSTVACKRENDDEHTEDNEADAEHGLFFPDSERHLCELCDKYFKSMLLLNRHVENVHQNIRPYSCDKCDNAFISFRELQVHKRKHESADPFSCEVCGVTKKRYRAMQKHIKSAHTGTRAYTCTVCLKSFAYEASLAEHKFTHPPEEEKPHQCELCGTRFLHALKLQRHMNTHLKHKTITCPVCQKQFKKLSLLLIHQLTHTEVKGYLCDKCGKSFKSPKTVAVHKRSVHLKLKPHMCLTCGKSFARSYSYNRHVMTHTGEKRYICDFCGYACNDLSNLKKHKVSHKK